MSISETRLNALVKEAILEAKQEINEFKIIESDILEENKRLQEEGLDASGIILREFMRQQAIQELGEDNINEELLQEFVGNMWAKVKHMGAKAGIGMGKILGLNQDAKVMKMDRKQLKKMLQRAGTVIPSGMQKLMLKKDKDGMMFPNQKDNADFANRLNAMLFAYGSILAALEDGKIPHETAVSAVEALRKFIQTSQGKLSGVYKVFKEENEVEEELINEFVQGSLIKLAKGKGLMGVNFNAVLKKAQEAAASGDWNSITTTIGDLTARIAAPGGARDQAGNAVLAQLKGLAAQAPTAAAGGGGGGAAATTGAGGAKALTVTTVGPTANNSILITKTVPAYKGLLATLGVSPAAAAAALAGAGVLMAGALYLNGKYRSRSAALKKALDSMEIPEPTKETNVIPEPGEPKPVMPPGVDPVKDPQKTQTPEETPDEAPTGEEGEAKVKLFNEKDSDFLAARIMQSLKSQGIELDIKVRGAVKNIIKDLAKQMQANKLQVESTEINEAKSYPNVYRTTFAKMEEDGLSAKTAERLLKAMEQNQVIPSGKSKGRDEIAMKAYEKMSKKLGKGAGLKKNLGRVMSKSGGIEKLFAKLKLSSTKTGGYVPPSKGKVQVGAAIGGKLMQVLPADMEQRDKQKIVTRVIKLAKSFLRKEFNAQNIKKVAIRESKEAQRWHLLAGISDNKKVI